MLWGTYNQMDCRLNGAKTLSEPVLVYCQRNPVKSELKS